MNKFRQDFPILSQNIHGQPLAYLDNAATTQKPEQVLKAMVDFYTHHNANVHRGIHLLSTQATHDYETAREKVKTLINAAHLHECVFVKGTTEGINLIANGFIRSVLKPGDEILLSQIEHHSNIVPWQLAADITGAKLQIIPCNDKGELILEKYANLLNERTKIVGLTHVSNALGTINPIKKMIELAHQNGTPILIDGAQAIAHLPVDVQTLDCDFYVFSGHKMYGPTGIGVIYAKEEWLEKFPPYQGGGEMIESVTFAKTKFNKLPYKFEAGTPPIAQAVGLGTAIDYLRHIGFETIEHHEQHLLDHTLEKLGQMNLVHFVGFPAHRIGIVSFNLADIHAHDVGTVLDTYGIAVRTGKHCAEPALDRLGVPATVRVSFAIYNTLEEIDRLIQGLEKTLALFKVRHE